ncbi:MAG TPA: hypothetical protein VGI96_00225 [Streptosporangiaceae bacterium]
MAHDKIKAAARRRMARTGESYTTARREVIRELQAAGDGDPAGEPEHFAISYKDMDPISTWADTRLGGGPAGGRIEVDAGELRLRMADFKVDVPRASIRRATRSSFQTRGTIGVHAQGGRWLANGSADGLVEIEIDPPCHTGRSLSTLLRRMKVTELIVSLVDPDGFIAAVQRGGVRPLGGSPNRLQ